MVQMLLISTKILVVLGSDLTIGHDPLTVSLDIWLDAAQLLLNRTMVSVVVKLYHFGDSFHVLVEVGVGDIGSVDLFKELFFVFCLPMQSPR